MKERQTPIERIPHLGFKQINLWKIYKAVEKLGAYELVTGRRLWKNVYDELGGSPGSTSAATCTRRHYERLVLPYVRHLKGEEDKPLPPSKPRKQYKVSKATQMGEKIKRTKKEKVLEQVPPEVATSMETTRDTEDTRDTLERDRVDKGRSSPVVPSPSGGCPGPCQPHSEPVRCLFSSFYSKGNHPIMSPLAKKKLLAQVTKAESLHCHKHPEPPQLPPGPHHHEQRCPEPSGAQDTAPNVVGPIPSGSPGGREEERAPPPTTFTGCFHAYRNEGLKPPGSPPLWGYFSSLKDFLEPPSTFPSQPEEPQDLRSKAWNRENQGAGTTTLRACWVPPRTGFVPRDGRDVGVAKPKAVVAKGGYVVPPAPAGYTGAMLYFPASFGNLPEHLKTQGVPVAPSLSSINPFIIPAFPSPLVATSSSTQPSELGRSLVTNPGHYPVSYQSSLRGQGLYPGGRWHSHHPPTPAFHHHTKL
ncbi:AT-rich interactive domain-containing protein 5A [Phaethornis superciliosus]